MTENNGLIYVSGRHVTAEKEAAAALDRAQRQTAHLQKMDAIGQLTGGIAHDFNNLLMIVSGHAQSLKNRLKEPKDTRAVQAIEMAATRGENLTRQLLSFARTLPLNPTVINPAEAVGAIRDVLAGSMHVNIKFHIDMPDNTWPVLVDKSELELALINLAVNARDAMPEGGRISIAAENVQLDADEAPEGSAGDFVALSVTDTGSGIPADLLTRVVEPFFTTKGPDKGTGLGLSQVYGFVKQSTGHVKIESNPRVGTTVRLYLPRAPGSAGLAGATPTGERQYRGDECVLVVEDDHGVRDFAVSVLREFGYHVLEAANGEAALELLAATAGIDLLFTDVVMPGKLTGADLAKAALERRPGLRLLFTSGYTTRLVEKEWPENTVDLLRKPYRSVDLAARVRAVLDRSAAAE
jgi:nitrogen-specific signal transduction histidine kinase